MGNRAVVFFEEGPGVYLHWNGGPESVLAFLQTMRDRGWTRGDYAGARFSAVVSEFFDADGDCEGLSVGLTGRPARYPDADPGDNGVYLVKGLHCESVEVVQYISGRKKVWNLPVGNGAPSGVSYEQFNGIRQQLAKSRRLRSDNAKIEALVRS